MKIKLHRTEYKAGGIRNDIEQEIEVQDRVKLVWDASQGSMSVHSIDTGGHCIAAFRGLNGFEIVYNKNTNAT